MSVHNLTKKAQMHRSKNGTLLVRVWPLVREVPSLIPGEITSLFQLLSFLWYLALTSFKYPKNKALIEGWEGGGVKWAHHRLQVYQLLGWFSNVTWWRESARKALNATSGAQFAALPLVKPVVAIIVARCLICMRCRHLTFPFSC